MNDRPASWRMPTPKQTKKWPPPSAGRPRQRVHGTQTSPYRRNIGQRIPSARKLARLMMIGRDSLTKAGTVMVAAIEAGVPTMVEVREIITQFHLMIRRRLETGLPPWIERARASLADKQSMPPVQEGHS
jgi:hypothetical protein